MTIQQTLKDKMAAGRKLLVPYLCAGFPDESATVPILEALADAGADAIELGIPFSDPLMDGPVIQAASHRALQQGMTLMKALDLAKAFTSRRDTPLFLMSSVNPLLRMGVETFAQRVREAGIVGCILPDLPLEDQYRMADIPQVQLVAPNTPEERVKTLLAQKPPFLYCVTVFGVTGARTKTADYTLPFLRRMKALSESPVLAGFGVSTPDQAVEMASACDGVIIGSALIRALDHKDLVGTTKRFLEPFRLALG